MLSPEVQPAQMIKYAIYLFINTGKIDIIFELSHRAVYITYEGIPVL